MINLRRLKGLRVEHDLTQEEFASWIGMPISTYRKKELGVSPIQLEEAYKISQLLGESIEDIFFKNKVPKQEHGIYKFSLTKNINFNIIY